jgi:3-oxoacyl-[acyl-carrier protein] reductase
MRTNHRFSLQKWGKLVDNQKCYVRKEQKIMDLQGRVALITGASSGIGHATVLRLAEAGADIAIGYGQKEQAALTVAAQVRRMGRKVIAVRGDVAVPDDVLTLVDTAEPQLGPIDILISNAGAGQPHRLEGISLEEWDRTMNVNLRPAFLLAQRVMPGMQARGFGRVIFVSSVAAFTGGIIGPHYAASKAGLLGLMHWLAADFAPYGVTVNAVAPALIADTGMIPGDQMDRQELKQRIPIGRLGKPEDVAEVIMMLITNSYMTNQTISIDGGAYPR